tara:strand:+ start:4009 stop:4437 length:429 start_codon:yes stop_codon:yes gene_type:complete
MPRTEPKTEQELAADRKASLPDALSEQALQRVSTGRVRYALSQLAQGNVDRVQDWLDRIEMLDGPKAAMDTFLKMLEYSVPKLQRTEVKVEDSAGNAIVTEMGMDDLLEMIQRGGAIIQRAQADPDSVIEGEVEDNPVADLL